MFSSLSRGSPKVRQSYICTSCLCNILAVPDPQHIRPVDQAWRPSTSRQFSSSVARAEPENGRNDSSAGAVGSEARDLANVFEKDVVRSGGRKKRGKRTYRSITPTTMPISRSSSTLKALRESLIAEGLPSKAPVPAPVPAPAKPSKKKGAPLPPKPLKVRGSASLEELESVRDLIEKSVKKGRQIRPKMATTIADKVATRSKVETAPAVEEPEAPKKKSRSKKSTLPSTKPEESKVRRMGSNSTGPKPAITQEDIKNRASRSIKLPPGRDSIEEAFINMVRESQKLAAETPKHPKPTIRRLGVGGPLLVVPKTSFPKRSKFEAKTRPPTASLTRIGLIRYLDGKVKRDDYGNSFANEVDTGLFETREKLLKRFLELNPAAQAKVDELGVITSLRAALVQLTKEGKLSKDEMKGVRDLFRTHLGSPQRAGTSNYTVTPVQTMVFSKSDKGPRGKPAVEHETGPVKAARGSLVQDIRTIATEDLKLTPLEDEMPKVPSLSYGLERVLFNPGVYHLQDPRSRVFNFDPYLQSIMPVSEFDFNALKQYITSSRDQTLLGKARRENRKYTGSTSSMTSALAHFHFLLSQWRRINTGNLSKMFPVEFETFTGLQRGPVSIFLRWRDGAYAIDADKQYDTANILSMLGKSMEKLLTLPTDDFEKYRKANSDQISEEERNEPEAFHYTTMGDFLLRSQLDAYDPRLPGTGMFDLKTRAVISVRMDTDAYEEGRGYEIRGRHGEWESFEREYYDMIRSAFLKYSLQVRMGRMDGIFVAFHNTQRIFGFQYISLPELDYALHGTDDTTLGDSEFKLSLELLNRVLDRATTKYPEQSLRLHFETRDAKTPFMYIFAEPITEEKIEKIQTTNKDKIDKFERDVLGLVNEEENEQARGWDNIRKGVEESIEQDENDPEGELANENSEGSSELDGPGSTALDDGEDDEDEDAFINEDEEDENEEDEEEEKEEDEEGEEDEEEDDLEEQADEADMDEMIQSEEALADEIETEVASGSLDEVETSASREEAVSDENGDLDTEDLIQDPAEAETDEEASMKESSTEDSLESSATEESVEDAESLDEELGEDEDKETPDAGEASADSAANPINESELPADENKWSIRPDMLAMTLAIRNKVNGEYVERPEDLRSHDKWDVEYAIGELTDPHKIATTYAAMKFRRKCALVKSVDLTSNARNDFFLESIKRYSKKGRAYRKEVERKEGGLPKKVLDVRDGMKMEDKHRNVWQEDRKGGKSGKE